MTEGRLSLRQAYGEWAQQSRQYGQSIERRVDTVQQILQKETEKERKDVEEAIDRFHKKVNQVSQRQDVLEQTKQIEVDVEKRQQIFQNTFQVFTKERQRILQDTSLTYEQKSEKIREMFNYFEQHFLTSNEKDRFRSMTQCLLLPMFPSSSLLQTFSS